MIHICYSGNKRVFPGLLLSVLSVVRHTRRPVRVHVLSMDMHEQDEAFVPFSGSQMQILDAVLKEANPASGAELLDVTAHYRATLAAGKNADNYYTPYTLLRLYLNELPDLPEKLLYLDIDTMCAADIGQLYDIDLTGFEYAAALDHMGHFWIHRRYCNAGVLLLNMKEVRQTRLFERARDYVFTHKMIMPDQTALHKLGKRRLYLPRRFNEQRGLREDTVVKHFCRGIRWLPFFHIYNIKQWQREEVHKKLKIHYFDDVYARYDALAAQYDLTK